MLRGTIRQFMPQLYVKPPPLSNESHSQHLPHSLVSPASPDSHKNNTNVLLSFVSIQRYNDNVRRIPEADPQPLPASRRHPARRLTDATDDTARGHNMENPTKPDKTRQNPTAAKKYEVLLMNNPTIPDTLHKKGCVRL